MTHLPHPLNVFCPLNVSHATLVAFIISQDEAERVHPNTTTIKREVKKRSCQRQEGQAHLVYDQLTPELKQCVDLSKEKGSSLWLSVLPLEEHMVSVYKKENSGMRYA